jgi:hypothetical protein
MPTFDTPGPITARIDLGGGSVRVRAGDRHDTEVTVRPRDERSSADVAAAERTRIAFTEGDLVVRSPRGLRPHLFGPGPQIEVDVALPEGSSLDVRTLFGDIDCAGGLGTVELESKYGELRVERAAGLKAHTAGGTVTVGSVAGDTEVSTAYGDVRVGETTGPARLDTSYGDVLVDRAHDSVKGTTKFGTVRVGSAVRGSLALVSSFGEIEAGIRQGTAAYLDVYSGAGRITNQLDQAEGPEGADETVEIHARTSFGDILIRRA